MSETFFGFKKVDARDKSKMVSDVFSSVASKYDIMNDAMSLGLHRLWKSKFCNMVPSTCKNLLDVAGGTGDIALKCKNKGIPNITLCDINEEMLKLGRDKMLDNNKLSGVNYVQGDAEKLPFPDNTFDCYTIAFGIRNVTNIEYALEESFRVLKKGGKFLCMEFSKVTRDLPAKLYDFYSFNIIPKIGEFVAGNPDAYQYLSESIRKFPDQTTFRGMIEKAGYGHVSYNNEHFGVIAVHSGYKL